MIIFGRPISFLWSTFYDIFSEIPVRISKGEKKGPFSPLRDYPKFFHRFCSIFLFLQEMCLVRLSLPQWTRFFQQKLKLPSKSTFYLKKSSFLGKYTLFLPDKRLTPNFFRRFWPNFFFLQEICLVGLSLPKWTRFFQQKLKLLSKSTFW